jgi:hypothetical protein
MDEENKVVLAPQQVVFLLFVMFDQVASRVENPQNSGQRTYSIVVSGDGDIGGSGIGRFVFVFVKAGPVQIHRIVGNDRSAVLLSVIQLPNVQLSTVEYAPKGRIYVQRICLKTDDFEH